MTKSTFSIIALSAMFLISLFFCHPGQASSQQVQSKGHGFVTALDLMDEPDNTLLPPPGLRDTTPPGEDK